MLASTGVLVLNRVHRSGHAEVRVYSLSERGPMDLVAPTYDRRQWVEETWSWQAPAHLRPGESGRLSVKCKIKLLWEVDREGVREWRSEVPSRIAKPLAVTVEGPFWSMPLTKVTPPNHPNPLEWSWVITAGATVKGRQVIQLELPTDYSVETERLASASGSTSKLESRFLSIPVEISDAGFLARHMRDVLAFLGWLLGGGLAAPYVKKIVRSRRRARRKSQATGNLLDDLDRAENAQDNSDNRSPYPYEAADGQGIGGP